MKVAIPYKDFKGVELRYTLRGIQKFIENPEVIIIGDKPNWLKNVEHISFKDNPLMKWKERNIFYKLLLLKDDFLFFNDDHYLLEPWKETYDYYGTLSEQIRTLNNSFSNTLKNTVNTFGDINSYFRHNPMFIKRDTLEHIAGLDWTKNWGYCVKSAYCALEGIKGTEYPDLKIRTSMNEETIRNMIRWRKYFSTGNGMNRAMVNVLEELYPQKSVYE